MFRFTLPARSTAARRMCGIALALGLSGALAACSGAAASSSGPNPPGLVVDSSAPTQFDGAYVSPPFAKPDLTLTDTHGASFNLLKGTAGKLTLLYFGYTHCPDVCPTTMATLASAVRALPAAQAAKIDVVFVSTDPGRDTPPVIHRWLDQFDPEFVGLTGPFANIQKAASSLGIAVQPAAKDAAGNYTVTHGAEVVAFDAKNQGYLVYSAGTTVAQFTHDIPLLLAGRDA